MALNEVGVLVYSRGLPFPETSILFENWPFVIGRGIIMPYSNTCYRRACRTINYQRRPRLVSIVSPRRCMVCHLNRTRLTIATNFIPTIRSRTISPAGVNGISPPNGVGSGCSRSMVCIECSKSPGFRTRWWSWKGRAAET